MGNNLRHAIIARDIDASKHIDRTSLSDEKNQFLKNVDDRRAMGERISFVDSFETTRVAKIHKEQSANVTAVVPIKPVYKREGFLG